MDGGRRSARQRRPCDPHRAGAQPARGPSLPAGPRCARFRRLRARTTRRRADRHRRQRHRVASRGRTAESEGAATAAGDRAVQGQWPGDPRSRVRRNFGPVCDHAGIGDASREPSFARAGRGERAAHAAATGPSHARGSRYRRRGRNFMERHRRARSHRLRSHYPASGGRRRDAQVEDVRRATGRAGRRPGGRHGGRFSRVPARRNRTLVAPRPCARHAAQPP